MSLIPQEDETLEDLQLEGLKILQKRDAFRFGTDSVLLAAFADVRMNDRVVDLGTGTGILPILLSAKTRGTRFEAVEIQPMMASMAERSVCLNGLEARIALRCADLRTHRAWMKPGAYDVVVANPPYMPRGASLEAANESKTIARREEHGTVEDFIAAAAFALRNGGRFSLILPVQRLQGLLAALERADLMPKRLQLIHPRLEREANFALVEAYKQGREGMRVMPPIIVQNEDGSVTAQVEALYAMKHKG